MRRLSFKTQWTFNLITKILTDLDKSRQKFHHSLKEHHKISTLQHLYVCMYVKLYLRTLAPSTVRWFPRGASTMLKITKDIKGKEDYLQIGVTPDVMVRRCYNLFQIYIVLELSFKWLLNRCIDSASFVSIERLFHSLAPLYLKLFFRNSLLGLGRAKSV